MASRYWIGGSGTWDASDTSHWSSTSGGASGASVPSASDDVYFDSNSFSGADQVVTLSGNLYCKNFIWTGATNTPTLAGVYGTQLHIKGATITLISGMIITFSGQVGFEYSSGITAFTSAGQTITFEIILYTELRLTSDLVSTNDITLAPYTYVIFRTMNYDITLRSFYSATTTTLRSCYFGSSTITITGTFNPSSAITVQSNTATILLSGTGGGFYGSGLSYYNLEINGTNKTIYDSSTFNKLTVDAGSSLILKNGTTTTVTDLEILGTAINPISIQTDDEDLRATIYKDLPNVTLDYVSLKNIIFSGTALIRATHSVDLGGNSGIVFINVALSDILSDIDTRLPNKFSVAQKMGWLNDMQRKVWRYFTDEIQYDILSIANQGTYAVPTTLKFENIKQVLVNNSTEAITDTTPWTEYLASGISDFDNRSYNYYKDNNKLGLVPIPEYDDYTIRIKYIPKPLNLASTDIEIPYFNEDYLDALKFGVMATIAKSGNYPDVELANNYTMDYNEIVRKAQHDTARRKAKLPRHIISYKEGWS